MRVSALKLRRFDLEERGEILSCLRKVAAAIDDLRYVADRIREKEDEGDWDPVDASDELAVREDPESMVERAYGALENGLENAMDHLDPI